MQIKDIAKVQGGYAFKSEQFISNAVPIIRIGNINGLTVDIDNDICYPQDFWNKNSVYRINKNDILIAMSGATVGKVGKYCFDKVALLNQRVCKLIPKSNIYNDFLYYYCLSPVFKKEIQENAFGCAQPNISVKQIETFYINVPNLFEQEKAIKKFKYISRIIDLYNQQLEQLDLLIKSQFVEMFGTPYGNEKGFPLLSVDDVIEFTGGAQPDKKYFEYTPTKDNIRLIQIRDYKTDNYATYIPKTMAKRFCDIDDIMIGRYGPPIFQILKGIEGSYNVALMKATPKKGKKEFVRYFLKQDCLFNYLDGLSQRTAGQSGIEMSALKTFPFPYPPIELQDKFEQFIKQVEKSKTEVQKALDEAQLLFNSLMQEYFD